MNGHRFLDCQRSVRGAHEAAQIAPHSQPTAEVSRDRAEVRSTPTADLHARHRLLARREVENARFVDLDLAGGRFGLVALPRKPV